MSSYVLETNDRIDVTDLAHTARLTHPRTHRNHGCELNIAGLQDDARKAAVWLARELGVDVNVVKLLKTGRRIEFTAMHDGDNFLAGWRHAPTAVPMSDAQKAQKANRWA